MNDIRPPRSRQTPRGKKRTSQITGHLRHCAELGAPPETEAAPHFHTF
jgi:hypothetical protein